ncbi:site-specific integrase, partial [Streptomyces sp. NPDC014995]|uniref:site-specific integrase n=1 Tax=Streptomyces sp. NPDC014995 TaxID=3364936 RepID=UPI003700592C
LRRIVLHDHGTSVLLDSRSKCLGCPRSGVKPPPRPGGDYLYCAYALILVLGLRKGEVLGLTWSDVNLDTGELHIRHQLQRVRRRLLHTDTAKTEASEAVLPLPDICLTALRLRQKEQQAAKERAKDLWTESDLVFTTRYGTPVEPRNVTREFDRRCERAGVRRIRVHDTRHTCASLLAALDVHPRIAMQILRHSEIAVTMEVYTHVPSADTRRTLRKLGKALGGGKQKKEKKGKRKQQERAEEQPDKDGQQES